MLKKIFVVLIALAVITPAFGGWSQVNQGNLKDKTVFDPETKAPVSWVEGFSPSKDRTVDWETDGNNRQRKAEVWNWPAVYEEVPIATINVQMEVGFWIRLDGCHDKTITLKQIAINLYQGEIGCKAKTNVATAWSASFSSKPALGGHEVDYCKVEPSSFDATGSGGKDIKVKLGLKNVDLSGMAPTGNCVDVGSVTVKVKPNVRPNIYMSGQSGSGAGFGNVDYKYYAPPTGY